MDNLINTFQDMIDSSSSIVFFGGAGVSTESGIPDFRSAQGLYSHNAVVRPEKILSHGFFMQHTEEFYRFYKANMIYRDAKPNAAHIRLAELERAGRLKAVVTQNIDGLHQAAGSKRVYELHGSVKRNFCMKCGKAFSAEYILSSDGVPKCDACGGIVKPDVVLYDEALDETTLLGAVQAVYDSDMFIVGGTSLTVYPAASLVQYYRGCKLVIINSSPTPYDGKADLLIARHIGEVFSAVKA